MYPDRNSEFVGEWISRMSRKHGGVVGVDDKRYDWGQALCVVRYGADAVWPDSPTDEDVLVATEWENKLPENVVPTNIKNIFTGV